MENPNIKSRNAWRLLYLLWALLLIAIPIWMSVDKPGWDIEVYARAMQSVARGHDPYAEATAIQRYVHDNHLLKPGDSPPWSFVYSPVTLLPLRFLSRLPSLPVLAGYVLLSIAGILAELWAGVAAAEPSERLGMLYATLLAPFAPGLLLNGTVDSGNIAFILYGAVLLAAMYGWKRDRWLPFYLVTLLVSCVKAPMLSLLALPVLSARRQWIPTAITAVAGVAFFAAQPLLWPTLFRNYLQAVDLQFSINRDFGCSPAGLFSGYLYDHHLPYSPAGMIFFLVYAVPLFGLLFHLSRLYLRGAFSWKQWFPVLLTGVILLNPRIMEYDAAPIALPLALIAWRVARSRLSRRDAALLLGALFVLLNAITIRSWSFRLLMDGPLIVVLFLAGALHLLQLARASAQPQPVPAVLQAHPAD